MKTLPPWILMLALGAGAAQAAPASVHPQKPQAPQRLTLNPSQRLQLAHASRDEVTTWLKNQASALA